MATFKDSTGAEWRVALNAGVLGDLKRDAGFDLGKAAAAGDRLGEILFGEPGTIADVVWVLVRDQAERAGLTAEKFAYLLDADTLDRAAVAVAEAVIDFFHRGRAAQMKAQLPTLLAKANREIEAATARAVESILNDSAGNSQGSAG